MGGQASGALFRQRVDQDPLPEQSPVVVLPAGSRTVQDELGSRGAARTMK
ncbi:hypothetical protein BX257_6500 [Streptomyces sp. 3212.3]|nr:hypothetical protein BX257_6500 [Streptomyces sp. 3212.3]